jgi:isohexenylglutaconyl-CoA hydratase
MSFDTLLLEQRGPVLHLTLNRPTLRNAMSLLMVAELRQVLAEAEASAESLDRAQAVRVLVLRGAGGHFCAGADLKDLSEARMLAMKATGGRDPIADVNAQFGELCLAYAHTPLAVVAVLEGTVMGGGIGLACVADVALASDTAVFRLPETSMGVVPAQIAPFLVERLGYSQAKRLAVTGGKLDAAAALHIGLVHATSNTATLDAALDAVLHDILACAPHALAVTKALMAKARYGKAQELVDEAARVFSASTSSAEGLEGITAFMQKRKPQWAPA